jgi:hypothetical protein
MRRKSLLTTKLVLLTIIPLSQPLAASAADLTPSITFNASNYVEDAPTWLGTGGTGTVDSTGMKKTTSGPVGVIFKGSLGTNNDRLAASIGPISETEVSVEMWIKLADNGSTENNFGSMLFSWGQDGGYTYNIYHYDDWIGFNTLNSELLGFNASTYKNQWAYFVFVMKNPILNLDFGSSNMTGQKIYVNGAEVPLTKRTGLASNHLERGFDPAGKFLFMDNSLSPGTWNAKGILGLARVYKGEIAAGQVSSLYASSQSSYVEAPPLAAPVFTLSSSSETVNAASSITGYTINSTGGAIASYSLSPAISNGLSFSTSTGLITGTPTSQASAVTYTITGTNATSSSIATFSLTVNPDPAIAEAARVAAIAEAARVAAIAAAAAKQQRELTELLSIIPAIAGLALNLGETTKALTLQKCVKKTQVKYVKKGAKCPKGFVRKK